MATKSGVPHGCPEDGRKTAQYIVTDLMSGGVVDRLEVVDIDKADRHRMAIADCPFYLFLKAGVECRPVRKVGQRIERARSRYCTVRVASSCMR